MWPSVLESDASFLAAATSHRCATSVEGIAKLTWTVEYVLLFKRGDDGYLQLSGFCLLCFDLVLFL